MHNSTETDGKISKQNRKTLLVCSQSLHWCKQFHGYGLLGKVKLHDDNDAELLCPKNTFIVFDLKRSLRDPDKFRYDNTMYQADFSPLYFRVMTEFGARIKLTFNTYDKGGINEPLLEEKEFYDKRQKVADEILREGGSGRDFMAKCKDNVKVVFILFACK